MRKMTSNICHDDVSTKLNCVFAPLPSTRKWDFGFLYLDYSGNNSAFVAVDAKAAHRERHCDDRVPGARFRTVQPTSDPLPIPTRFHRRPRAQALHRRHLLQVGCLHSGGFVDYANHWCSVHAASVFVFFAFFRSVVAHFFLS